MALLGLDCCLLFPFHPHAFQQLEVCVSGPELCVDAVGDFLEVADYSNSFLFFAAVVVDPRELDVVVGNGDVAGIVVEVQRAQIARGRIDDAFALTESPSFLSLLADLSHCLRAPFLLAARFAFGFLDVPFGDLFFLGLALPLVFRTGIADDFDVADLEIAQTHHMDFAVDSVAAAADVAIERSVDLVVGLVVGVLGCVPAISDEVGVAVAPREGGRLGSADVSCQFCDFDLGVNTLFPAGEREQLGVATDFVLKPLLELLASLAQLFVVLEEIEVGEDSEDCGEAVALEEREELEGFHFEAETGVDDKQHDVCHFGEVDHGRDVGRALHDADALLLVAAQSYGPRHLVHLVLRVVLHQRTDH